MEGHQNVGKVRRLHRNEEELEVDVRVLAAPHVDDHGVQRHPEEPRRWVDARYDLQSQYIMGNYSDGENTDDEHIHILSGFLIKARRFETDTIYSTHIQSDKEVEGKGADVEVGCE